MYLFIDDTVQQEAESTRQTGHSRDFWWDFASEDLNNIGSVQTGFEGMQW